MIFFYFYSKFQSNNCSMHGSSLHKFETFHSIEKTGLQVANSSDHPWRTLSMVSKRLVVAMAVAIWWRGSSESGCFDTCWIGIRAAHSKFGAARWFPNDWEYIVDSRIKHSTWFVATACARTSSAGPSRTTGATTPGTRLGPGSGARKWTLYIAWNAIT